jgi:erythromycin esterase-like protein
MADLSNRREPTITRQRAPSIPQRISEAAEELPDIESPLFASAFDRYAQARVVLLGECTHGTSEFYRARAAITRRLIEHHGFSIVAVEADWPDASIIDSYVRDRAPIPLRERAFQRFPTWMWRNVEVEQFVEELRSINVARPMPDRAAFYGLDLYALSASIRAVLDYLDRVDPKAAAIARQRYGCLTPWADTPQRYGRAALTTGYAKCEAPVIQMLGELLAKQLEYVAQDGDDFLDAAMNARLIKDAEAYYRAMYYGAAQSWNLRDTHMFETLREVLKAKGAKAKAVVWAHNSHIGDASKTDMGAERDELNIGQLCREQWGDEAALIGFGTHAGTVACASDWDEPMEIKQINPSRRDSVEHLAHVSGVSPFLLDLRDAKDVLRQDLSRQMLQRFIGVIYRPDTERWSHYSHCALAEQYDGYVWFDETTAVTPLPAQEKPGAPETYPFGL